MPIQRYGVLRGKALAGKLAGKPGKKPHYQIHILAAGVDHRIAVNVVSDQSPSELAFLLETDYQHPVLNTIREVNEGFTPIPKSDPPHELALDFVRGNLFQAFDQMKVVPHNLPGPDNDLNEVFSLHLRHAIDRGADLFAFGAKWGPENNKPDEYFGFQPGNGIHDIHLNQGSPPPHKGDNGVWQDGALFMHFPSENKWLAFFLAFQSQHPQTDAKGDLVPGSPDLAQLLGKTGVIVPAAAAEVRIVAALVNPAGDDVGLETVTLVNLQPQPVDLAGWKLVDGNNKQATLAGPVLAAGDAVRITLSGLDVQLSNKGGTLSLLDSTGRQVHGVAYTKAQVAAQGWSVVF